MACKAAAELHPHWPWAASRALLSRYKSPLKGALLCSLGRCCFTEAVRYCKASNIYWGVAAALLTGKPTSPFPHGLKVGDLILPTALPCSPGPAFPLRGSPYRRSHSPRPAPRFPLTAGAGSGGPRRPLGGAKRPGGGRPPPPAGRAPEGAGGRFPAGGGRAGCRCMQ